MKIRELAKLFSRWIENKKIDMMRKHDRPCPLCNGTLRCQNMGYCNTICDKCGKEFYDTSGGFLFPS